MAWSDMAWNDVKLHVTYVCGMKNASSGKKRELNDEWLLAPSAFSTSPPIIPVPLTTRWICNRVSFCSTAKSNIKRGVAMSPTYTVNRQTGDNFIRYISKDEREGWQQGEDAVGVRKVQGICQRVFFVARKNKRKEGCNVTTRWV